ncbi:MAG: flagellar biosynthetic protein FliR [Gammaproteobacteria bacterium]|nr:flagellar biosynthetic protein FliR [Gammaproteobacteria bacterium]NNF60045.1 flagellar biosynthetic protein FliR [Gammaproteobacteria bacterium]NNM19976.1 flagellar biosynthetic protein FliR [Gammaproteobacteria bacterium]
MHLTDTQIIAWISSYMLPFVRIAAALTVAPVFSARLVPARIRLLLAFGLTLVIAPLLPPAPVENPLSAATALIVIQQFVIGLIIGAVLQMVFDAMVVAGQTAAMSMGLGFAFMIDSQRGVSVPVLSQFFLVLTTLVYLAIDGHLALIKLLADSFTTLPVGEAGVLRDGIWATALWGSKLFAGAMLVALPAVAALLVVNFSFGVMSRAAPTLNLFAVGFPVTLTLGFVIILWSLPGLQSAMLAMTADAFAFLNEFLAG